MDGLSRDARVARVFMELADTLVEEFDVVELLTTLTRRCLDVGLASAAAVLLASPGGDLQLAAASSEDPPLVELIALQAQEGPCYESFDGGAAVGVEDLGVDAARWPEFALSALAQGFRAAFALPLRLRGSVIGVLGLLHREVAGFSPDDVAIAQAVADVATICVLQHRTVEEHQVLTTQLNNALDTRVVIEQAKGVIVGQTGWTIEESFDALRRFARATQRKLTDVALDVIAGVCRASPSGELVEVADLGQLPHDLQ